MAPCRFPAAILADTPPTLVRADFTSSAPFGHQRCVAHLEKKKRLWAATKMDHHLAMRHADVNEIMRLMTLHAVYLPLAE